MKYAHRFARVAEHLRRRGFRVIEVPGWQDRGHGDFRLVQHITFHHTATGGSRDYASLGIVTHGRSDLPGPLTNFGVGRFGTIYLVAAGVAWHAGPTQRADQGNRRSVAIEAENNGRGEPWGPRILSASEALVQELRREFGVLRRNVEGHKETCRPHGRKIDPANFDMDWLRRVSDPPELEDDFMAALTDAEQREILDRVRAMDHEVRTNWTVDEATGEKRTVVAMLGDVWRETRGSRPVLDGLAAAVRKLGGSR